MKYFCNEIFGDKFYSRNASKLRPHEFLHFQARKHYFTIRGSNSQEIVKVAWIMGPQAPELNWKKES